MATPKVLLKRSSVSANAPGVSDLEYGELAINFADGRIYYKNSSNEIKNFIDSDILTSALQQLSTDSAEVVSIVTATVDKAFVDALGINATQLQSQAGSYYLDYNNFTNTPNILDSSLISQLVDSSYVQLRQSSGGTGGLDSALTTQLIDSDYIELRRPPESVFNVTHSGSSAYTFNGDGFSSSSNNPTLYLTRGKTYKFAMAVSGHPFQIRVSDGGSAYSTGVTNNGAQTGSILFTPDMNAPTSLVYQCTSHSGMVGNIVILDNTDATGLDSALASQLIDSAYIQLRQSSVGSGGLDSALTTQLIDSSYIQLRQTDVGLDSSLITQLVDSAYTQLRVSNQGLRTTDSVTFAGLTVTGTTTTVHSDNLRIKDPLIHLADSQSVSDIFDIGFVGHYAESANGPSRHTGLVRDATNSQYYLFNDLVQDGLDSTDNTIQVGGTDWALANLNAGTITANLSGNVVSTGTSTFATVDINGGTIDSTAIGVNSKSTGAFTTLSANEFNIAHLDSVDYIGFTSSGTVNLSVIVDSKTDQHRYTSTGSSLAYWIDGKESPFLLLSPGNTYRFTLSSSSMTSHPFRFYLDAAKLTAYTTNVTSTATYTEITITDATPPVLHYQCSAHGYMGNAVNTQARGQLIDSAVITSLMPKTGTDFADSAWIVANFLDSALTTQLIDSSYVQLRQSASGLDSALTSQLVDSAYIQLRQATGGGTFALAANTGSHTFNTASETLTFLGTTGQINAGIAANNVTLALDQNINSITSVAFEGDSANAHETKVQAVNPTKDNTISLPDSSGTIALLTDITGGGGGASGVDSAATIALIDSAHVQARQSVTAVSPLILTNFIYAADSGQTSFTGADRNGAVLAVDSGKLQVFLNGILLSDSDFSHNSTKVDLTIGADSADILTVVKIGGNSGVSGFQQKHFIYNADSGQTVFTGADASGNVLSYSNFNRTNVYLNGIMLISGTDFTATNGSTVTLVDGADSGDVLDVNTFIGSNIGLDSADAINLIDSAYVTARAGAGTDSAAVLQLIDSAHVALKAKGMDYNILANTPTIPVTGTDFADSAWITLQINNLIDGAPGTLNTLNEIAAALNDDDSAMDTLLALINAKSDVDSVGSLSNVTYGVPTAGQILKYDAGTSKFILSADAGGLDSSLTSQLIDSAYVQARGTGVAPFELTNFIYTADSGQVTFTGADDNSRTLAIDSGKLQVFLNGILLSDADFSHNASKVDLTIAADSADILTIVKMDGNNTTSNFQSKHFVYNADSGQTAFTGADRNGEVLRYSSTDRTNVYLNGILLLADSDFTATNGTTLTLTDAADSGDVLDINVFRGSNISLDSAEVINLVDSAYVAARAGAGTDSATVLNLIDSAHVNLHAVGLSYTRLTNTPTIPGLSTHFIDSAEAIKLITANAIDSSIAIQLLLDSAETINLIDSAHVQLHAVGLSYNRLTNLPSIPVTGTDFADSAWIISQIPVTGTDFADSSWIISQIPKVGVDYADSAFIVATANAAGGVDSALTIQLIDSAYVRLQTRIGDSDIDFGANKIKYANVYSAEADLPSASTYHGMFAHVHATGAGYFAHGGNWIRLANKSEALDSSLTSQLIDSSYIQLRQTTGGTIDSAYVEANSLDSERTLLLIDSDYILARVTNTQPGEFNNDRTEFTVGGADSGRRVFDTNNTLSLVSGNTDVFLNGILQVSGTDYTIDSSAVTFTSGVAANHQVTVLERAGKVITQRGLVENIFAFTTAAPATSITGTDDKGATLDVSEGYADVFLNGILLRDSDDYSINGAGTTLTLVSATDSSDIVTIKNSKGVIVTPQVKRFEYTTATPATTISGSDLSGNTLAYVPGSLQVHLNGILLQEASDFTASTGNSIVLTTATDSADDVSVSAFSAPGSKLELYKFTADSGQTVFSGNDVAGRFMSYEPGNIQVFLNGLLLNDSDDYTASNTKAIRLLTGAALNDELKVASFETTSEITRSNTWSAPSGTVSAAAGDKLFIDTSGGARTITLPSSATMGDEIRIIDVTGNAGTNNITVSRNGHNIQGAASDLVINIARAGTGLAYYNATQGWVLIEN